MMTKERLAEIREREQAATPGPWEGRRSRLSISVVAPFWKRHKSRWASICRTYLPARYGAHTLGCHFADVSFIAHAREDVPALLTDVEELRRIVAHLDGRFAICLDCDLCTKAREIREEDAAAREIARDE